MKDLISFGQPFSDIQLKTSPHIRRDVFVRNEESCGHLIHHFLVASRVGHDSLSQSLSDESQQDLCDNPTQAWEMTPVVRRKTHWQASNEAAYAHAGKDWIAILTREVRAKVQDNQSALLNLLVLEQAMNEKPKGAASGFAAVLCRLQFARVDVEEIALIRSDAANIVSCIILLASNDVQRAQLQGSHVLLGHEGQLCDGLKGTEWTEYLESLLPILGASLGSFLGVEAFASQKHELEFVRQ